MFGGVIIGVVAETIEAEAPLPLATRPTAAVTIAMMVGATNITIIGVITPIGGIIAIGMGHETTLALLGDLVAEEAEAADLTGIGMPLVMVVEIMAAIGGGAEEVFPGEMVAAAVSL